MAKDIDPQRAIERMKQIRDTGTAWMARQAVGDAVLILLRDRELTRAALVEQLQQMAAGRVAEWAGTPDAARKAAEFILSPPPALPSPSLT